MDSMPKLDEESTDSKNSIGISVQSTIEETETAKSSLPHNEILKNLVETNINIKTNLLSSTSNTCSTLNADIVEKSSSTENFNNKDPPNDFPILSELFLCSPSEGCHEQTEIRAENKSTIKKNILAQYSNDADNMNIKHSSFNQDLATKASQVSSLINCESSINGSNNNNNITNKLQLQNSNINEQLNTKNDYNSSNMEEYNIKFASKERIYSSENKNVFPSESLEQNEGINNKQLSSLQKLSVFGISQEDNDKKYGHSSKNSTKSSSSLFLNTSQDHLAKQIENISLPNNEKTNKVNCFEKDHKIVIDDNKIHTKDVLQVSSEIENSISNNTERIKNFPDSIIQTQNENIISALSDSKRNIRVDYESKILPICAKENASTSKLQDIDTITKFPEIYSNKLIPKHKNDNINVISDSYGEKHNTLTLMASTKSDTTEEDSIVSNQSIPTSTNLENNIPSYHINVNVNKEIYKKSPKLSFEEHQTSISKINTIDSNVDKNLPNHTTQDSQYAHTTSISSETRYFFNQTYVSGNTVANENHFKASAITSPVTISMTEKIHQQLPSTKVKSSCILKDCNDICSNDNNSSFQDEFSKEIYKNTNEPTMKISEHPQQSVTMELGNKCSFEPHENNHQQVDKTDTASLSSIKRGYYDNYFIKTETPRNQQNSKVIISHADNDSQKLSHLAHERTDYENISMKKLSNSSLYVNTPDFSKQTCSNSPTSSFNSLKQLQMKPPDFTKISSNESNYTETSSGDITSALKSNKSHTSLYKQNTTQINEQIFAEISKGHKYISDLQLKNPPIPSSNEERIVQNKSASSSSNLYMRAPGFNMQHFQNNQDQQLQEKILNEKSIQSKQYYHHSSKALPAEDIINTSYTSYAKQVSQSSYDEKMPVISSESISKNDDYKLIQGKKEIFSSKLYSNANQEVSHIEEHHYQQKQSEIFQASRNGSDKHFIETKQHKSCSSLCKNSTHPEKDDFYSLHKVSADSAHQQVSIHKPHYIQQPLTRQSSLPLSFSKQREIYNCAPQNAEYLPKVNQSVKEHSSSANFLRQHFYQTITQSVNNHNTIKFKDHESDYLAHHPVGSVQNKVFKKSLNITNERPQDSLPHNHINNQQQFSCSPNLQSQCSGISMMSSTSTISTAKTFNQFHPSASSLRSLSPQVEIPRSSRYDSSSSSPGTMNPPHGWPNQPTTNRRLSKSPVTSQHHRMTSPVITKTSSSSQNSILCQSSSSQLSLQASTINKSYKTPCASNYIYQSTNEFVEEGFRANYVLKTEKVPDMSYNKHINSLNRKVILHQKPHEPVAHEQKSEHLDYANIHRTDHLQTLQKYSQENMDQYHSSKYSDQVMSKQYDKPNYREMINHVYAMRSATTEEDLNYEIIKRTLNKNTDVRKSDNDLSKNIFDNPIPTKIKSSSSYSSVSINNSIYSKPLENTNIHRTPVSNKHLPLNMDYEIVKKPIPNKLDYVERTFEKSNYPHYNDFVRNNISVGVPKADNSTDIEKFKTKPISLAPSTSQLDNSDNALVSRVGDRYLVEENRHQNLTCRNEEQQKFQQYQQHNKQTVYQHEKQQHYLKQSHVQTKTHTESRKYPLALSSIKRESPLDLSVKTVKTKADSTGCDECFVSHSNRLGTENSQSLKVDFSPNFSKHTGMNLVDNYQNVHYQPNYTTNSSVLMNFQTAHKTKQQPEPLHSVQGHSRYIPHSTANHQPQQQNENFTYSQQNLKVGQEIYDQKSVLYSSNVIHENSNNKTSKLVNAYQQNKIISSAEKQHFVAKQTPSWTNTLKRKHEQSPDLSKFKKMELVEVPPRNNSFIESSAYIREKQKYMQKNYAFDAINKQDTTECKQSVILNNMLPVNVYNMKSDDHISNVALGKHEPISENSKLTNCDLEKHKNISKLASTSTSDSYALSTIQKAENPYTKIQQNNEHLYTPYTNERSDRPVILQRQQKQISNQKSHHNSLNTSHKQHHFLPATKVHTVHDNVQDVCLKKTEIQSGSIQQSQNIEKPKMIQSYYNYPLKNQNCEQMTISASSNVATSPYFATEIKKRNKQPLEDNSFSKSIRKHQYEHPKSYQLSDKQITVDELYGEYLEKTHKQQQQNSSSYNNFSRYQFQQQNSLNSQNSSTKQYKSDIILIQKTDTEKHVKKDIMDSRTTLQTLKTQNNQYGSQENSHMQPENKSHQISVITQQSSSSLCSISHGNELSLIEPCIKREQNEEYLPHKIEKPLEIVTNNLHSFSSEASKLISSERLSPNFINNSSVSNTNKQANQNVLSKLKNSIEMREYEKQKLILNKKPTAREYDIQDNKSSDIALLLAARIRTKGELKGFIPIPSPLKIDEEKCSENKNKSDTHEEKDIQNCEETSFHIDTHSENVESEDVEQSELNLTDWSKFCNNFVEQLQTNTTKKQKRIKSHKIPSDNSDIDTGKAFDKNLPIVEYKSNMEKSIVEQIKSPTETIILPTTTSKETFDDKKDFYETSSDEDKPLLLLRQQSNAEQSVLESNQTKDEKPENVDAISFKQNNSQSPFIQKSSSKNSRHFREKQRLEQEKRMLTSFSSSTSDSENEYNKVIFQRLKKLTRKTKLRTYDASARNASDTESSVEYKNVSRGRKESKKRKFGNSDSNSESNSISLQKKLSTTNAVNSYNDEKEISMLESQPSKIELITKAQVKYMEQSCEEDEDNKSNCTILTKNNDDKFNMEANNDEVDDSSHTESKTDKRKIDNEGKDSDEDENNSNKVLDASNVLKSETQRVPPLRFLCESFNKIEETMTRSKRKKELEKQMANSKILRNDKVVQNKNFGRKIRTSEKYHEQQSFPLHTKSSKKIELKSNSLTTSSDGKSKNSSTKISSKISSDNNKRKNSSNDEMFVKKKAIKMHNEVEPESNSENCDSKKSEREMEEKNECVSNRLRSRRSGQTEELSSYNDFRKSMKTRKKYKEQNLKGILGSKKDFSSTKSLITSSTTKKSSAIKSNSKASHTASTQKQNIKEKFPPGWEIEVYQYKRALKVPPNLISIKKSIHHKTSTSLPNLDHLSSDASEMNDNSKKSVSKKPDNMEKSKHSQRSSIRKSKQLAINLKKIDITIQANIEMKSENVDQANNSASCDKPKSIIDVLHSRLETKKSKKKSRILPNNEPKLLPQGNNEAELLPTPIVKKNTKPPFGNEQKNVFETEILKSRTRTETKVMQRKELIREVFGGEDRPASAPPEIPNTKEEVKVKKMSFDEKYKEYLQKMNIDFGEKIRKNKKGNDGTKTNTSNETTSDNINEVKQDLIIDESQIKREEINDNMPLVSSPQLFTINKFEEETRDTEINDCLTQSSSIIIKEETQDTNERDTQSAISERDDTNTPLNFNKKKIQRSRNGRRKCGSSGFDYIRKKKRPTTNNVNQDTIKKRRLSPIDLQPTRSENDVSKEIQKWVLNKSVGQSALHKAARLGYLDVVAYCLERLKMNPNLKDNAGYTPLHEACSKGRLEIAKILLEYGANHSETAHSGIRPLHEAIENGYIEIVRLLLSYGADPLVTTYSGQTPLELAENTEMETFLKNHLCDIQNTGPNKQTWQFPGPWHIYDSTECGYDVFAMIEEFNDIDNEYTTQIAVNNKVLKISTKSILPAKIKLSRMKSLDKTELKTDQKFDSNSNIMYYEHQDGSKSGFCTLSTKCSVLLNNIDLPTTGNSLNTYTYQNRSLHEYEKNSTKIEQGSQSSINKCKETYLKHQNSELTLCGEMYEFEEFDKPLPPVYHLKDEGTDKWVLLNDLCNLLKVKSKDTLLKQIYPTVPPSTINKELLRELKLTDFLEKATCLQLLCAGEKVNICSSKVVLVKYNESVRNMLGVETFTMEF